MNPSEMREFIRKSELLSESVDKNTEEELFTLSEARGFWDKISAAVGEEITKQDIKKELRNIRKGWTQYSTAKKASEDDVDAFKKFLTYWNFGSNEIDEIVGNELAFNFEDALERAAGIQYLAGTGTTGEKRGGPFKKPETQKTDDPSAIFDLYVKQLGGNPNLLQAELASIKKPDQLGNNPLAMLGYAFVKAGGSKGKK